MVPSPPASLAEERVNSLTHGVGALLSLAGLAVLVTFSALNGTVWHVVSGAIFGATLVLLYTASTLYHAMRTERWKGVFQKLDHAAIFLLIAGTYTPFLLVSLRGPWGWSLLGVIWGLGSLGAAAKLLRFSERFEILSTLIYVAMGWLILIAIRPLMAAVPFGGLALLMGGGVFYTVGTVFYLWHRLPYHHAVWHLFVLGGSACHFFSVLIYLVPPVASAR